MTQRRPLLPYLVLPALPLLVPLVAMQFTAEVQWSPFDFVAAYLLFAGASLLYRIATHRAGSLAYRAGTAVAVFAGLSLIWVNLAVGFIGDEDNPANLLYGAVLAVGLLGAIRARGKAAGMSRTLYAAAAVQAVIPIIAWFGWRSNFDENVTLIFFLNGCWVFLLVVAGLLFRNAAEATNRAAPPG